VISRLWGVLEEVGPESVILRAGPVGYRVLLSPHALARFSLTGESVTLRTLLLWSEHQETPTLVGFVDEREEVLFHEIRRVGGLGATKAIRMISSPPETIWQAIATGDVARLKQLKGVGETTARKLIAELKDRLPAGLAPRGEELPDPGSIPSAKAGLSSGDGSGGAGVVETVREILTGQFGHSPPEADRMIRRALSHKPAVKSVEDLFNEVYRHGVD
jgi:Holliday junction DNA helicase RuvA